MNKFHYANILIQNMKIEDYNNEERKSESFEEP